jgi:hypothetical protein
MSDATREDQYVSGSLLFEVNFRRDPVWDACENFYVTGYKNFHSAPQRHHPLMKENERSRELVEKSF